MANGIKSPLNLILGAGNVGDKSVDSIARFDTPEEVNTLLDAFAARGYRQIDTARNYSPNAPGSSEPRLGAVGAGDRFIIDTKVKSREPGSHTKDKILQEIDMSLEALQVKQINIEYLHQPDRATDFMEACVAMDQAHRQGKIKHWGISNYAAEEVEKIVLICKSQGLVQPSVYQGQYNPIVRGGERDLFPILRKYNIAFYAYSPAAAGFFASNHKNLQKGGRFDTSNTIGKIYSEYYLKPAIQTATDKALATAAKYGIGGHAAALRWTAHHSMLSKDQGDAIILGASSVKQLEANLDMVEQGPLPDEVVAALERLYEQIGGDISYLMV
ncbi:aflatoxin B1 aldehyde reductase member 2 [Stachybotrys elegans]|uniref:Aflatoxin B1 aldehyde reductase member 2 n=1 Tax=Stachybotrys elegans TaxID=80388 RepID=A0A8K0SBA8_9HYPO|nr:aflatoxin B1 aldehyde reductase member 2 [Stachybotrys elegans]